MKITSYENEDALDLLVECMDPIIEIFSDEELKAEARGENNQFKMIKIILKNHKKSIITVLATLEGVPVEEYHANLIQMTKTLMEILNDEELQSVFHSQG